MLHCFVLRELRLAIVLKRNKCTLVAHLVTVVWCREDGDTLAVVLDKVAFVLDFVRTDKQLQIVVFQESLCNIRPERQTWNKGLQV